MPDTNKIPPTELPVVPLSNNSDLENPIRWFDEFILEGTPERYVRDFFRDAENKNLAKLQIDYNNDSYRYVEINLLDKWENKIYVTYTNYLMGILAFETHRSCSLIDSNVLSCATEDSIRLLIKKLLNRLKFLSEKVASPKYYQGSKYPIIRETLATLISHIYDAHSAFFPDNMLILIENTQSANEYPNISVPEANTNQMVANDVTATNKDTSSPLKENVKGFSFINNTGNSIFGLYDILISLDIIKLEETDFVKFSQAFSGNELKAPLEIRWHLLNQHKSVKVPIIRMINHLSDQLQLLKKVSKISDAACKIENIFVDQDGKKLNATEITMYNFGKKLSISENIMLKALDKLKIN